jgi:hypothetical protein
MQRTADQQVISPSDQKELAGRFVHRNKYAMV